ncbi:MAG: BrnA antitoxin family protein [Terracidiphilus sp.]
MKRKYDLSKGKRGRIAAAEPRGKTRITIRLDEDLVDHFLRQADASGGDKGYQTLINEALRQHVDGKAPQLEDTLRRIVREEMRAAS